MDIVNATMKDILAALKAAGITTVEDFGTVMKTLALDVAINDKLVEIDRARIRRDAANAQVGSAIAVLESELAVLRAQRVG